MKKIFIVSAGDLISGGIQSLHNLAAELVNLHYDVSVFYLRPNQEILQHPIIQQYHLKRTYQIDDNTENLLIVSETETNILSDYKNIQKAIYWLSIRFFFKCEPFRPPFNINPLRKTLSTRNYFGYGTPIEKIKRRGSYYMKSIDPCWNKEVVHLTNSYHAFKFCQHLGVEKPYLLHNPLRKDLIELATFDKSIKKENLILFGPKTPKYIILSARLFLKNYQIKRVKRIKPEALLVLMESAKLFCEFGNSPGRDRMPREAALFKCIVLTNNRGGAGNKIDLPIDAFYKINDHFFNIGKIIRSIKIVLDNYESHIQQFEDYRKLVIEEPIKFKNTLESTFQSVFPKKDSLDSIK